MVKRQNAIFMGYMLAFSAVYLGWVAYAITPPLFGFGVFGSNVATNEQTGAATTYSFSFGGLLPLFVIIIALMATMIFFSFKSFKKASQG
jgi:hypothetical protein